MSKTPVFINEIHYRNLGIDKHEGVEIAGPAGTNLKGWSLCFYKGDGSVYNTVKLQGLIANLKNGFGALFFPVEGLINTSGGVALVNAQSKVILFLSYDKVIQAIEGPASGLSSELLPITEGFWNSVDNSLQLVGKGSYYEDFKWVLQTRSNAAINERQTFVPVTAPAQPETQPAQPTQPTPTPTTETPAGDGAKAFVSSVDLQASQNRAAHKTSKYNAEMLILRRGQTFSLAVKGGNLSSANVKIVLTLHPEDENMFEIPVKDAVDPSDFSASFANKSDTQLSVIVNIPATAIIGHYSVQVQANDFVFDGAETIVILFNPWSKLDTVFMDNQSWCEEYVLNDQGLIWTGQAQNNSPVSWNFAQFQSKSLSSALILLEKIPVLDRADPAIVSRKITSYENRYVLEGNWSGNFEGGTSPSHWTGSKEILAQFYQTHKRVKYGQCWVFSGVLCSLLRALGIPCRPVTNFESAHDTDENRRVDKYYDVDGKYDDRSSHDSIWNFHVWDDAWFTRPDLPDPKFNGWQAVDATPQEKSEGEYQTGPCPLAAIKTGEKVDRYDWTFIYAEVNADVTYRVKTKNGDYKVVKEDTDAVGKCMSTKAVGKMAREDVTLQYKYPEGSTEERKAFDREEKRTDLLVNGSIEVPEVETGSPIPVDVVIKSLTPLSAEKKSKIVFSASIVYYTGKPRADVIKETKSVSVPSDGSETTCSFVIEEKDYLPYLNDNHHFELRALFYSDEDADVDSLVIKRFVLKEPIPQVDVPSSLPTSGEGKIVVSFTNPLSIPLTNLVFAIEGSGVTSRNRLPPQTIGPKETTQQVFLLKENRKPGERNVKVLVSSKELETVHVFKTVNVV